MRDIRFRAWDKIEKEFTNAFSINYRGEIAHQPKSVEKQYFTDSIVIQQFTGLKDKNGVEIYEGDILDFDADEWGNAGFISAVEWDSKNGCWGWGGGGTSDLNQFRSVIGNIYENPELLKESG